MKVQINSFDELPQAVSEILNQLSEIKLRLDNFQGEEGLPEIIDSKEAANLLQVSVPTLYNKVSKREVPHLKKGKRLRFYRSELIEYLNSGRRQTKVSRMADLHRLVDNDLAKSFSKKK